MIEAIKRGTRDVMRRMAAGLDHVSGGRITPNGVTVFGFAMHLPIAYFVATGQFITAAILLVIFGLFDTLDGELARLQKRTSDFGGLLDASTDRLKEVLLYSGAAYYFAMSDEPTVRLFAAVAVVACGVSIAVSFVKSKGETILATKKHHANYAELNRIFAGGLFPFEIRMTVFVLGLVTGWLAFAIAVIAFFSSITVVQRLNDIRKAI